MSDLDTLLRSRRQGTHPPITVRDAQHMLDRVPTMIFSGADGGYTTPAPHGRHTWWFGDTVSVNGWLHNSTMIQSDGVLEPDTRTVIPKDPETGTVYWPAHATLLPDGRLLVPCGGLVPTETESGFIKGIFHRSVPLASLDDPAAWSAPQQVVDYITDGSWSPWIDETSGHYFALTMSLDTRTVRVYGAESGEGPWRLLAAHPSPWEPDGTPGEFFYVAHAHPWMTMLDPDVVERGEHPTLACTVSHTSDAGQALHDYRIRFFGIPYPDPDRGVAMITVMVIDPQGIRLGWESLTISSSTPAPGLVRLTWDEVDGITTSTPSAGVTRLTWTGD